MPLISVITPVYNKEKYIADAMNSVLSQEYRDIEYVVIDDGSTDESAGIVDAIASKDERVKVIHQENQWIYASFNNGVRAASGDYVYILNADDKLRDGALGLMACKVLEFSPDVVWTKVLSHKVNAQQQILEYDYAHLDDKVTEEKYIKNKKEFCSEWLFLNQSLLALNQANLYRRELMLKHPFRNDVYAADTLFNISIAADIETSYIMKEPIYDFYEYESMSNASVGKYYGYEHQMFNDLYIEHMNLVEKMEVCDEQLIDYICRKRLQNMTSEIKCFEYSNCKIQIEEILEKITNDLRDGIVYECAKRIGAVEEFESRFLSGIRSLLIKKGNIDYRSSHYFWYDLLEALLRYEKTDSDMCKIEQAINNPLNPFHIGRSFWDKLS